ncbi:hypothetical protein [Dyella sp. S184]|uniref:hypothetical protein n=1 Tax=Dyella sp. S184 TaxID=1641862 RepID=UPI00131B0242|nr:hypothetical protein [Dyella sp. S184]
MIREDIKGQLGWVALWGNSLADQGKTATFDTIHAELERGTIIHWLGEQGADMSLQLGPDGRELTEATVRILQVSGASMQGREGKKLAVRRNGFCLLVALVLHALAVDEEY